MTYNLRYAQSWSDIEIDEIGMVPFKKELKNDKEALAEALDMLKNSENTIFVSVEKDGILVGSFWNKERLEDKLKEVFF